MADCESLLTCPFFNDKMADMPATAEIIKKKYCKSDFINCARHKVKVTLGKESVPSDLMPNRNDKATEIIARKKGLK